MKIIKGKSGIFSSKVGALAGSMFLIMGITNASAATQNLNFERGEMLDEGQTRNTHNRVFKRNSQAEINAFQIDGPSAYTALEGRKKDKNKGKNKDDMQHQGSGSSIVDPVHTNKHQTSSKMCGPAEILIDGQYEINANMLISNSFGRGRFVTKRIDVPEGAVNMSLKLYGPESTDGYYDLYLAYERFPGINGAVASLEETSHDNAYDEASVLGNGENRHVVRRINVPNPHPGEWILKAYSQNASTAPSDNWTLEIEVIGVK